MDKIKAQLTVYPVNSCLLAAAGRLWKLMNTIRATDMVIMIVEK
jgi:hypothetical protein